MAIYFGDSHPQALIMLMGALGGLYAASRIAGFALAGPEGSAPGRRAVAQWIPVAGVALAAVFWGHADIALAVIFSTSVAFLMLVTGITTWLTPLQALPPSRNVWPFLFPVALLVFMAGMSGHLAWWHALMMLALGGAILAVWVQPSVAPMNAESRPPPIQNPQVIVSVILGLTLIGAVLAVGGTLSACKVADGDNHKIYPGTFAAAILSPLLIVPTLGSASTVAQRGQTGNAITALIGSVFLNLCFLLPIVVLIWHFDPGHWDRHQIGKFFNIRWGRGNSLPFDLPAWQIETVSLIVIGFALVPVAIGRWTIGRLESSLLLLGYLGYIGMLVVFGIKQM